MSKTTFLTTVRIIVVTLLALCVRPAFSEAPKSDVEKLVARLGNSFWSSPEKRLVRATTYKRDKTSADENSAKAKSDEKIGLLYASKVRAGTIAVPYWLPRGSMVKIFTEEGVRAYIAADEGSGVESRAAAKDLGKTREQIASAVLDFCAEKQLWPDFTIVEIYYYAGKVPFTELSLEEQKTLFAYAAEYVAKRE